jgi:hypothetical protein
MRNTSLATAFVMAFAAFVAASCTQTPSAAPKSAAATAGRAASSATTATGTWTWTYDGGDAGQAITHTYTLKQTGETLTGTFKDSFDDTTADIKDGKIHNGQVSFTVARPFMDTGSMNFTFTGKLEGNTIKGQATWTIADQPTTADWTAKRGT